MLDIPEVILQKLICSICKKYLSVLPIKVYPNRQVKCGRCCEEGDGGTVSVLYQTIIQEIRFPCIFRMEGCRELLLATEMKSHEEKCSDKKYSCLVCAKEFIADSFALSLHIDKEHEEDLLKYPNFPFPIWTEASSGSSTNQVAENRFYFYTDDKTILYFNLLVTDKSLCFEPYVLGCGAEIQFSISSAKNKLIYKTEIATCSEWGKALGDTISIDIATLNFLQGDVLWCSFELFERSCGVLRFNEPVILDSVSHAILRFDFKNISNLECDNIYYSHNAYYVKNVIWKIFIEKYTIVKSLSFLQCYLKIDDESNSQSLNYSAKVKKFTLLNKTPNKNISNSNMESVTYYELTNGLCYLYVKWDTLVNKENGFLSEDDSITIEVDLSVEIEPKKCDCVHCTSVCTKEGLKK